MHTTVNMAHALSIAAGTIFLVAAVAKSVEREGVGRFVEASAYRRDWPPP